MNLVKWTVWNPVTRRPKRSGQVEESLLDRILFNPDSERMLLGEEALLRQDEIGDDGKLRRIPQEVLDAERAAKLAAIEPDELAVLIEALKAKHGLTDADLAAARTKQKGGKG